jgi:hypothetical protein
MAKTYPAITDELRAFIEAQRMSRDAGLDSSPAMHQAQCSWVP